MTSEGIDGDDTGARAFGLRKPEPWRPALLALKPKIHPLDMLTTPGVPGRSGCPGWGSANSPPRSGSDRSILSEVNHRLESRMREIRRSGLEGGGDGQPLLPIPIKQHD